jgi:hypothetical protein
MKALAPPKKERGLGTTLKTAELTARYRFPRLPQVFSAHRLSIRRCVDHRQQLLLRFGGIL